MASPEEIEEKIREKRILEANKKGLVGQNGKIGTVLRIFGSPIISQSEGGYYIDRHYLEDPYEDQKSLHDESNPKEFMKQIPIMNMETNDRPNSSEWTDGMPDPINYGMETIGIHFDGLSRGMHLEIKYDNLSSELIVLYKGYVVYKEIKGEILSYAPYEEWEKWIESLYKVAKEKLRKLKEEEFEDSIKVNEKEKSNWWNKIKEKWGIN